MAKVIFEYTKKGRYASQGEPPSNAEGYNIWVQYPDETTHFLGFDNIDRAASSVQYYEDNGDEVVFAMERL